MASIYSQEITHVSHESDKLSISLTQFFLLNSFFFFGVSTDHKYLWSASKSENYSLRLYWGNWRLIFLSDAIEFLK